MRTRLGLTESVVSSKSLYLIIIPHLFTKFHLLRTKRRDSRLYSHEQIAGASALGRNPQPGEAHYNLFVTQGSFHNRAALGPVLLK